MGAAHRGFVLLHLHLAATVLALGCICLWHRGRVVAPFSCVDFAGLAGGARLLLFAGKTPAQAARKISYRLIPNSEVKTADDADSADIRSEERRVGKEC